MNNVIRVALPGYNAVTDTNPDHFSLYSDEDNVLIKRFVRGSDVLPAGETHTINHNLQYIPFYMVHYDAYNNGQYRIMNNGYNPFSMPQNLCAIDNDDLIIKSFQGRDINYGYDIFYDEMDSGGTPEFTESNQVIKIARAGKSINSKNPNDYIMHSDLNNLKILKQGKVDLTINDGENSFNHGADVQTPYKFIAFVKFPDGKTTILGGENGTYSYDTSHFIADYWCDGSKIYLYSMEASSYSVSVSYIFYGTGKDNTVVNVNPTLACVASGKNVFTEKNPDNFNFHSNYSTLKYFKSGIQSQTVSGTTNITIAHNLGYVPFFMGFGNDWVEAIFNSGYAILPYIYSQSFMGTTNVKVSSIYADSTNVYLRAMFIGTASGSTEFQYAYKIFKNNLGL